MLQDEYLLSEFKKMLKRSGFEPFLDFDRKFHHQFSVVSIRYEDLLKDTRRVLPPNRWSYYRIVLITRGSGDFITGIYKYRATANTLIFIPQHQITSSHNWSDDAEGYVVLFNMDLFNQSNFVYKGLSSKKILTSMVKPYVYISPDESEELKLLFETIMSERRKNIESNKELVAIKVIELLLACERLLIEEQNADPQPASGDLIIRFRELLETNYVNERSVAFYASELGVHPNHLNAVVKKVTGETAKEAIQNRLLIEIKFLLHSTNLSIKEISSQMGFNDPNYLSTVFNKYEHMTPLQYRASLL
jgi:AraC-type DNA-binding domain-containing proteins